MMHLLAQTTQPAFWDRWTPEAITGLIAAITALLVALKASRDSSNAGKKAKVADEKADTNQSNIQSLGAAANVTARALNQSPGGFNVPADIVQTTKDIATSPEVSADETPLAEPIPAPTGNVRT